MPTGYGFINSLLWGGLMTSPVRIRRCYPEWALSPFWPCRFLTLTCPTDPHPKLIHVEIVTSHSASNTLMYWVLIVSIWKGSKLIFQVQNQVKSLQPCPKIVSCVCRLPSSPTPTLTHRKETVSRSSISWDWGRACLIRKHSAPRLHPRIRRWGLKKLTTP